MSRYQKLSNPIVEIDFCGFRANTLELQAQGWDFSVDQVPSLRNADRTFTLAMRYKPADLHMITHPIRYNHHEFMSHRHELSFMHSAKYHATIMCVNPIMRTIMPTRLQYGSFTAMDAMPELEECEEWSLRELPFKSLQSAPEDIIIDPAEVGMWMKKLLDAQDPLQQQIRRDKIMDNKINKPLVRHANIVSVV